MSVFDRSKAVLLVIAAIAAASGCLQTDTANLDSDFDTEHDNVEIEGSADALYQESMSAVENASSYEIEADNRMVMNLPVFGVAVNMTSEGEFEPASSDINSTGSMRFSFGGNSNSTGFMHRVRTDGNSTVSYSGTSGDRNQTETEKYSREELGVSLESLRDIEVENASLLGEAQLNGERIFLLELNANSTDLMENSATVFEKHSPVQESSDRQNMEELGSFDEQEVYLWISQDSFMPAKFAYYGSASQGSIQVRSVTEYRGES